MCSWTCNLGRAQQRKGIYKDAYANRRKALFKSTAVRWYFCIVTISPFVIALSSLPLLSPVLYSWGQEESTMGWGTETPRAPLAFVFSSAWTLWGKSCQMPGMWTSQVEGAPLREKHQDEVKQESLPQIPVRVPWRRPQSHRDFNRVV